VVCSRRSSPDVFQAALCSFGCLGVITGVVLQVVPAFDLIAEEREERLAEVLRNLNARIFGSPLYRFWWFPHTDMVVEWSARPVPPRVHRPFNPFLLHDGPAHPFAVAAAFLRYPVASVVQLARDAVAWIKGTIIGFYLLQLAFVLGHALPLLVPFINRLWRRLLFASPKRTVDRSDRVMNFDCLFPQHVDEWSVPVEHLGQVMMAIRSMLEKTGHKAHFPVEVRFSAADDIWLSPAYSAEVEAAAAAARIPAAATAATTSPAKQSRPAQKTAPLSPSSASGSGAGAMPSTPQVAGDAAAPSPVYAWIGIISYKPFQIEASDYKEYFRRFEEILALYGGRPHWAKDFHFRGDEDFAPVYPRWYDFKALRERLDPSGVFANDFVRRTLGMSPHVPSVPATASATASSFSLGGSGSTNGSAAVFAAVPAATTGSKATLRRSGSGTPLAPISEVASLSTEGNTPTSSPDQDTFARMAGPVSSASSLPIMIDTSAVGDRDLVRSVPLSPQAGPQLTSSL
jgi:L-gulonolactone oxidase